MIRLMFTAAFAAILFAGSVFSDNLPTSQGRWSLSGSVTLPFIYTKYREYSFNYALKPDAGYFVIDGLELACGVTFTNILDYDFKEEAVFNPPSNFYWGIRGGATYYIPVSQNIQPYVGVAIETLMVSWELKQLFWSVRFPLGVTWFLNSNVALNFGIPIAVDFSSTAKFEKVSVNPGYLGVKWTF